LRGYTVILLLTLILTTSALAQELMPFQGDVRQGGALVNNGNLTVTIYDTAAGGNAVYNGSFTNVVNSGRFDVVLGNNSPNLLLNFSQIYYLEFYVNGNLITPTRQSFQSSLANGLFVHSGIQAVEMGVNLSATGQGSVASGMAQVGGNIFATNTGSHALGYSSNGTLSATGAGSFSLGYSEGGDINSTSLGSIAIGSVDVFGNVIISSASGSFAGGRVSGTGSTNSITASGEGSFAFGVCSIDGGTSRIAASSAGTFAQGYAIDGALISASSEGAFAQGHSTGGDINATASGARAQGYVDSTGYIASSNLGSLAEGYSISNGVIQGSGIGSTAKGFIKGAGNILASGSGAFAQGHSTGGDINATGNGSRAEGYVDSTGYIVSSNLGSIAIGYAAGTNNRILSTAKGSFAGGAAANGFSPTGIYANNEGAFAYGYAIGDVAASSVNASAAGSIAMGVASNGLIAASGEGSLAVGRAGEQGIIRALKFGSFAQGYVNLNGEITQANGTASVAHGRNVSVEGDYSFGFGQNMKLNASPYQVAFFDNISSGVFMINRDHYNGSHALVVGTNAGNGNSAYLSKTGTWQSTSSRKKKEDFQIINKKELLDNIESLDIYNWRYKGDAKQSRHIGPFSEDIYDTFQIGESRSSLSATDVPGINIVAIQELIRQNKELQQKNAELEARLGQIEQRLSQLKQ
jgi:hypothetical protein